MNLIYSTFSTFIYSNALYKKIGSMGEIRHQHIQALLAAALNPLAISTSTLMNETSLDHNTGSSKPCSLRIV